ncbi:5'-methylthioadenosine/adenosylhomocysteine nucleosidase [Gorillibacterium sp. sgz5001074]|uniref:5'-methylthioadenosine/adenosylhomocysteine nucleosidase n=1 Tax=Gorillibacterium sp. sgz5001074 TaxID=3446695 RepID=UPI003F66AE7B
MSYRTVGIIGAMKEEIDLLERQMEVAEVCTRAGIVFIRGRFQGKDAVVCKSGVGKVNAAVTTQLLIDAFGAEAVIFTGVAGALDPELEVGDIVVSVDCVQHDVDVTALGFPRGTIPFQETSVFTADPDLVRLAEEAGRKLFQGRAKAGRVLSGDQFIADKAAVAGLRESLQGACTEMEGAAVAQVCHMNGIPFVVIRSMSDKADGSAHVSFAEFTVLAANNSYRIVEEMMKGL